MNEFINQQWNAGLYDSKIGYVSKSGQGVVQLLEPRPEEHILDLGCGTGDLAYEITQLGADCTGIDSSPEMIALAQSKYPNLTFEVADGHTFQSPRIYDAVFSNAALHWMKQPERVLASVRQALPVGGRFVAEFGGKGNVARIRHAIGEAVSAYGIDVKERDPWYFPSVSEYSSLLERSGFEVRYIELFDRPTLLDDGEKGLQHWLDAFAGMFFVGLTEKQKEAAYASCQSWLVSELFDGSNWIADYRRLRLTAVRLY
jgi:trans-aconitate methyltransferase